MFYAVNPKFGEHDELLNDSAPVDLAKPSVVLLHGPMSSLATFSAQVSELSMGIKSIIWVSDIIFHRSSRMLAL